MPIENLEDKVTAYSAGFPMWKDGQRILIAVSGGSDSMALAHFMHTYSGQSIHIAHINHQLRGDESDREMHFVKSWSERQGIPCSIEFINTIEYQQQNKLSLEDAARKLRYAALRKIAYQNNCFRIATAHHLQDNLETTLMNIIRGSGVRGLSGIPPVNGNIIRPFLCLKKEQIESYIKIHSIPYFEDSSNQSKIFIRNKLRHDVIPVLKEINPNIEAAVATTNTLMKETQALAEKQIESIRKRGCKDVDGDIHISLPHILNCPAPLTVLYHLLSPFGFNRIQVASILDGERKSGKIYEHNNVRVICNRHELIVTQNDNNAYRYCQIDAGKRIVHTPEYTFELSYVPASAMVGKPNPGIAYINADKITFPLFLRPWKRGDYFYPSGLFKSNGQPAKKKVSDLFTDAKKSLIQKEKTPILLSGDHIIWVAGMRQDERFIGKSNQPNILKIKMLPKKGSITY